ncbi:hypothetical protein F5I97DRAFT_789370 [Phlebopus sp. FC_14]|nr:hypothetical protein F5I97DRAFT_789370 [Phlebopus sp. FC_14]
MTRTASLALLLSQRSTRPGMLSKKWMFWLFANALALRPLADTILSSCFDIGAGLFCGGRVLYHQAIKVFKAVNQQSITAFFSPTLVYATSMNPAPSQWYIPAASWSARVPAPFHNPRYSGRPSNPHPFARQRSCLSSSCPDMTPRRTANRVRFANDPAPQYHYDSQDTSGRHDPPYGRDYPFQAAQQTRTGAPPESNANMRGIFEARSNPRHNPPRSIVRGTYMIHLWPCE